MTQKITKHQKNYNKEEKDIQQMKQYIINKTQGHITDNITKQTNNINTRQIITNNKTK